MLAAASGLAVLVWMETPPATHLAQRMEARLSVATGRSVPLGQVAPIFVRALVATEDERFFRHDGIDVLGLARAIPYDLVHLSFSQGGSTLTEQVAKRLYLNGNDHTPWRKLEDMALAVKLERHYTKAQILDAYLNITYFGEGAYGIGAASTRYFDISPRRLSLAQASLLAGLPQAPSADDPLRHPAAARARQVAVLRSLVRVGAITEGKARSVLQRPLTLRGGARLPVVSAHSIAPGSVLAWGDAAAGLILAGVGIAALLLRRAFRPQPLARWTSGALAVVLLLMACVTALRSFRTL